MIDEREQERIEEQAALFALGALTQHEARAFEQRLADGEDDYAAALQSFAGVVEALSFSVPEDAPSHAMRDRLFAQVAATPQLARPKSAPVVFENQFVATRYQQIEWQELAPGLLAKELFKDPVARTISTLYRLEPGTTVGSHTHPGVEQCFILEGDFIVNGESFGPGDFHCAMPDSVHELITTTMGTTLLVVAPYDYAVAA